MTSGSAASQARYQTGAPLSLFRAGWKSRERGVLAPMAWRSPPGCSPAPVAAMKPPRTRVLLVVDRAMIALDLQRALREAGFQIVGPATSVEQTRRLLTRFAIDCAIVDLDGLDASAEAELLEQSRTPFVILTSRMNPPEMHVGRPRLHEPFDREDVAAAIERAIARHSDNDGIQYPAAPPIVTWPRIMPQL